MRTIDDVYREIPEARVQRVGDAIRLTFPDGSTECLVWSADCQRYVFVEINREYAAGYAQACGYAD